MAAATAAVDTMVGATTVAVITAAVDTMVAVIMVAVTATISVAGIMAAAIFTAARRISVRSPGIARFPPSARISRAAAAL